MNRRSLLASLALTTLPVHLRLLPSAARAQATSEVISLAASGLHNPRGLAWDSDDVLHVAVAGDGGSTEMGSTTQEPVMVGGIAGVMEISDGCPVQIAHGLPSTRGMSGHEQGPAAVAFLDGKIYVLQDSAGTPNFIADGYPNGLYVVEDGGDLKLVADISTWVNDHPVAHIPYDKTDLSETFALLAGQDGKLWVLESNSGQVLTVTTAGEITRIADLSENHPVPTGFALAPAGGVYVGFLTPAPYTDGTSRIVHVTPDGEATEVWTGLTMVTGIGVDAKGTLYAIEMATGNTDSAPFTSANTGRLVRQTGKDTLEEVVIGIDYPIAAAFGPDGGMYISFPAFGGDDVTGGVARVDVASISEVVTFPPELLAQSRCPQTATPIPTTPSPTMTSDDAEAAATEASGTATAPAATPPLSEKTLTGAVAVDIKSFAFNPAEIQVKTGTVVTWTNSDPVAHTATAPDGEFNSGNLNQGQSFSFTFSKPGTFPYICSYHPFMKGTITVVS